MRFGLIIRVGRKLKEVEHYTTPYLLFHKSKRIKLLGDLERKVKIKQVWGLCDEKDAKNQVWREARMDSIVEKLSLIKDGKEAMMKKEICMCWVNTKPKMTYVTTLYLSHTLQAIEDLFYHKSSELPTLVENGMPNKPMESYTLTSHGITM